MKWSQIFIQLKKDFTEMQSRKANYLFTSWVVVIIICHLAIIYKINFSRTFSQEYHQSVKQFVTRGIIWKINMQELWLLCMTHRLNVLNECMKFHWNNSNSY